MGVLFVAVLHFLTNGETPITVSASLRTALPLAAMSQYRISRVTA
jgi:hypothetical protein